MKVLMPVSEVPIGSTITKKTGEKEYTVREKIRIFGDNTHQKEICADDNTRFLISDNGDINVISGDTEVLWLVTSEKLYQYLYEIIEKRPFADD